MFSSGQFLSWPCVRQTTAKRLSSRMTPKFCGKNVVQGPSCTDDMMTLRSSTRCMAPYSGKDVKMTKEASRS